MSIRKRLGLLGQRNFGLLWLGETISETGSAMENVATPLLAVAVLHAGAFMVGLISTVSCLPWLLVSLPVGVMVDRLPSRRLMVAADFVSAAFYLSLPVAVWADVLTIGQVLLVALVTGAANVVFSTAYEVNLRGLITVEELVEGNAKLQGSQYGSRVFGPSLGGLLTQACGAAVALLANGLSFLVSAACLLGIRAERTELQQPAAAAAPRPATRKQISGALRLVLKDPYLRPMAIVTAMNNFAIRGYTAIVVVFLVRGVGLDAGMVGVLLASSGAGGLLGSLAVGRVAQRFGTSRTLWAGSLCTTTFALLIPFTGPGGRLVFFVAGAAGAVLGIGVNNIISGSFKQAYCPPQMLGTVSAAMRFLTMSTSPLGALFGGALGSLIGVRPTMWVLLLIAVSASMLYLTPAIRRIRNLPAAPPDASPEPAAVASEPVPAAPEPTAAPVPALSAPEPVPAAPEPAAATRS